jgi:O-antigen/teichoic acid export membrane protein
MINFMRKNEVGKGVIFMYIQLISSMITGFVFYIILARITSAEIIGTFSLVVAISEIIANIAILGIPESIQRFFGKYFLQKKLIEAKLFVRISIFFIIGSILVSASIVILIRHYISEIFHIDLNLIIIIDLLIASYAIYTLLYSIVVASLKTKSLALIVTISSVAKVILATVLILIGSGVIGLALGYTFFAQVLSSILLGVILLKLFESAGGSSKHGLSIKTASKNLLIGGLVVWIPTLITTVGIDLGTLVLYDIHGAYQSGIYFVTFAMFNALNAVTISIFAISLPVLSSMTDGRKMFTWQTMRLGSIIALPLSSSLIFYSSDIMQLIGTNYAEGSFSFQILLISMFPNLIFGGVEALVFAYGDYRYTLIINLASSIPRTILYFVLVPFFGMTGVAMSYTIGSLVGFIVSSIIGKRIKMIVDWRILIWTLILPISIGFTLSTLNINYVIGIICTIIVSYLILIKLHIVLESDISFLVGLLPDPISNSLTTMLGKLKKISRHFYK